MQIGDRKFHDIINRDLRGTDCVRSGCLTAFAIEDGGTRHFEACQSPVWDTCLAAIALHDAGVDDDHAGHDSLMRAAGWLLEQEGRVAGDWAVRRPDLEPGGWAFEFENDNYPDLDDTAEVILALRGAHPPDPRPFDDAKRGTS